VTHWQAGSSVTVKSHAVHNAASCSMSWARIVPVKTTDVALAVTLGLLHDGAVMLSPEFDEKQRVVVTVHVRAQSTLAADLCKG
jgi:hypothetical protein